VLAKDGTWPFVTVYDCIKRFCLSTSISRRRNEVADAVWMCALVYSILEWD
jgi:hypothetical protein